MPRYLYNILVKIRNKGIILIYCYHTIKKCRLFLIHCKYRHFLVLLSHTVRDGSPSEEQGWLGRLLVDSCALWRRLDSVHQLLVQRRNCVPRDKWMAGNRFVRSLTVSVKLRTHGICPRPRHPDSRPVYRACGAKTRRPDGGVIFWTAPSPVRDAVQRAERKRMGVFSVGQWVRGLGRAAVGHDSSTVELQTLQCSPVQFRPLPFVLRSICQQTSQLIPGPRPPRLDDEDVMFVVTVHAAFVEMDGGVPAAGTLTAVNEVEAAQTSWAVLAVQFSNSPLGLDRNHRHMDLDHTDSFRKC